MKKVILVNFEVVTCETCEFHNLSFMAETCSQCHNHEDYSPAQVVV